MREPLLWTVGKIHEVAGQIFRLPPRHI
jgi:hypothetical protein